MKEIIYNYDLLEDKDINNEVARVKALIINSNNEILFGYADKTYQLVGGHVEKEETLMECLSREIKEESGIEIKFDNLMPFLKIKYYSRNYPSNGLNTITTNNYYVVRTDLKPNYDNRELTDYEKEWDYTVKYVKLDDALDVLEKSIGDAKKKNPLLDTIEAIKEYIKICGDDTRRDEWQ